MLNNLWKMTNGSDHKKSKTRFGSDPLVSLAATGESSVPIFVLVAVSSQFSRRRAAPPKQPTLSIQQPYLLFIQYILISELPRRRTGGTCSLLFCKSTLIEAFNDVLVQYIYFFFFFPNMKFLLQFHSDSTVRRLQKQSPIIYIT